MKRATLLNAYRADVGQRIATERDAQGRVWCQLFPLGEWHRADFPGGSLELTPELFASFISNWRREGSPALPIDYHHEEQDEASGWIEDLRVATTGALEGAVKWTDDAASLIKADKYRYLSPTWAMQYVSRTSGEKGGPWLYGAALLNDPYFHTMPRVAATATPVAQTTPPPAVPENHDMTPEQKKRLAAALKCAENCTDEEMVAKCEAAFSIEIEKEDGKEVEEAKKAAAEATGKLTAALGETTKLQARNAELESLVKGNAEALFERDFETVFEAGIKEGRAGLPSMKGTLRATAKAMGLDVAAKLIATMGTVPLAPVGVTGAPIDSGDASAQFEALVAEKLKAGVKATDAYRLVASEHRELALKAFPTTINPSNTRA